MARGRGGRGGVRLEKVLDFNFLKSVPAVLLAVQAVCSLLALILAGSWQGDHTGSHTFFLLVMTPTFLASFSLLVCRAISLDDLLNREIPWDMLLAGHSLAGFVLVLIASCLMVEAAKAVSVLKAAGVFGLFAWNSLLVGSLLHGRPLLVRLRGGAGPATHSATVTPGGQDAEAQDSSDEWSDDEASTQGGVTFVGQRPRPQSYAEVSNVVPGSPSRAKRMSAVYDPSTGTWAPSAAPGDSWAPAPKTKWAPDPAPAPATAQTWAPAPVDAWDSAPAPENGWDVPPAPVGTESVTPASENGYDRASAPSDTESAAAAPHTDSPAVQTDAAVSSSEHDSAEASVAPASNIISPSAVQDAEAEG